jgi:hypothetical protein
MESGSGPGVDRPMVAITRMELWALGFTEHTEKEEGEMA